MTTLGDEYPLEQARCRGLLEQYTEIGLVGTFAHAMISQVLQRADRAAISGDLVAMINAFKEMKGCQ